MKKPKPYVAISDENLSVYQQKIGKRMQELRKGKGYKNYETFAYEHDLPRAQYGRYERGLDLKVSSLLKVLHALGVSAEEFFKGLE